MKINLSFLFYVVIKLSLTCLAIALWLLPVKAPEIYEIFGTDTLRYSHDAYILAIGSNDFYGYIHSNPFVIRYGGFVYKYFLGNHYGVGLVNAVISIVSTGVLFFEVRKFTSQRIVTILFFLCHFFPVIILNEALLGKEVFYLAGLKLSLALLLRMEFRKGFAMFGSYRNITILFGILLLSMSRILVLAGLVVVVVKVILKKRVFVFVACVCIGILAFMSKERSLSFQIEKMERNMSEGKSKSFQVLKTITSSDSHYISTMQSPFRMFIYMIYPFPLIVPEVWNLDLSGGARYYSQLLLYSEQSSMLLIIAIVCWSIMGRRIQFSDRETELVKNVILFSLCMLIIVSITFPFIHARYRIFYHLLFFAFAIIIKSWNIKKFFC